VLLDLAPLPSLTRWRGWSTAGPSRYRTHRSPSSTIGSCVAGRALVVAAIAARNRTPHRDRVIDRGGVLFRFPFVDQDGPERSWRKRKARSRLRAHDAEIKSAARSVTPGAALILVFVLRLQTTLFHRISHLTNCKDRKEGHPPLLVRAQGLINRLPRIRDPLKVS